jgi:hypothetical protein
MSRSLTILISMGEWKLLKVRIAVARRGCRSLSLTLLLQRQREDPEV